MFFKEIHEMRIAVTTNFGKLVNSDLFLIMSADIVNNGTDFFFLAIAF